MYIDSAQAAARANRAAFYIRVSPHDPNHEPQLIDLRKIAIPRGCEVVAEFTDKVSGEKAKRPGLDQLLADARRGRFDLVMTWSCDRIARSTRHLLEILDELRGLRIDFCNIREELDTSGLQGSAIVFLIGAINNIERSLISERVRAGMRRVRINGQHIGIEGPVLLYQLIC
jgi:DNA invertase Pin-like site-specific DNA recombinase